MPLSITLPNVRKLFLCDPDYIQFEADLKGADAQVVAWEADDDDLKDAFRKGLDVHSKNAEDMWSIEFSKLEEHSYARRAKRQQCKQTVHALNYGASTRTVAITNGWTVREADRFASRWFSLHPGIRRWHERIQSQLKRDRTVRNPFGFRRVFFDRIDGCFTEALAWLPQSTVALNTFHGAFQLEAHYWPAHSAPDYFPSPGDYEGLLLQTHDSINFQFRIGSTPSPEEIAKTLLVKTPYEDPLYIPWELKQSTRSWGDMASCK